MPPKKEAKNASSDAPRQLDKLKRVEGEVIALQRQLQMLTIEHKEARALEQSWRRKVGHYEAVLAKKDQDMDDITKSMARKSTVRCTWRAVDQSHRDRLLGAKACLPHHKVTCRPSKTRNKL